MTKQELKDYRYTCKCIKQLESELNDAAVTDSTQGSRASTPMSNIASRFPVFRITIHTLPRMEV